MDEKLLLYIGVGFLAQMVDGALGMAHGVISTTFLLNLGISPVSASAGVHTTKVFTTLASGLSHWKFGNVERQLVERLAIPGIAGGVAGAVALSALPGESIKPFVALYLVLMGLRILARALRRPSGTARPVHVVPLGLAGGFFDAIGGGGWGPIVTSTMVANGYAPRYAIGSVNMAEFFVAAAQTFTFVLTIHLTHWEIIAGLIIGGLLAAPLAAFSVRHIPVRPLMGFVGLLIIALSLRTIVLAL